MLQNEGKVAFYLKKIINAVIFNNFGVKTLSIHMYTYICMQYVSSEFFPSKI